MRLVPDPPRIRRATRGEEAAIARVERLAATLYAPWGLAERLADATTLEHAVTATIDAGTAWVAEDEGEVVGFALATLHGTDLHLDEIGVVPSRIRRGIGSRLMRTVLDEARVRGARRVTLVTVDFVPWTLPFYARHGFRRLQVCELDARLRSLLTLDDVPGDLDERSFGGRLALVRASGVSV